MNKLITIKFDGLTYILELPNIHIVHTIYCIIILFNKLLLKT